MDKIAFVFSGQGAQKPGMGKALYETSPAAARVFDMAEARRPGLREMCFSGDMQALSRTVNTQPCLFAVDLAAAVALEASGITPDCVAGFSLGEIPALAFAGILSYEDAFDLVCVRAEAMQACADGMEGGMAAVLGLEADAVEAACEAVGRVYPVNYNCPGQIVIAGERDAIEQVKAHLSQTRARVMPLPVGGAFHTVYMQDAAQHMAKALSGMSLNSPRMPIYANVTAKPYEAPYEALITQQVMNPVRWQATIEGMAAAGVTKFVEVGIGKTLVGFIKKTSKESLAVHVEDDATLAAALEALNGEQAK